MFHDKNFDSTKADALAQMGSDVVAYMREMTAEEIISAFPDTQNLEAGQSYWALFGANGTALMLASDRADIAVTAVENNLKPVLPN